MRYLDHLRIAGTALKRWLIAQLQDAVAVSLLWLGGLIIIDVPLAPLWALLAFFLQFVPQLGIVVALVGPAITAAISGGWLRLSYVLILYAVIVMADGLVLQPALMKRTARVPIWASILTPIALGLAFSFWGVLLAPPILAVIYAYRTGKQERKRDPGDTARPPQSRGKSLMNPRRRTIGSVE
jgi:predicted PurR-regulated permease PerM